MAINWTGVQHRLDEAGFRPGAIDGVAGPLTYAALLAFAAGRMVDLVLAALGRAASELFPGYGIDATPARLAEFIAQTAHETGGYRRFEEDLGYSAEGLRRTWPTRFPTLAGAAMLAGRPHAIAEAVYGGRMGNDAPGDGWRYRGRGCLQLTGKANYARFGRLIGVDLLADPDRAADPAISLHLACAFWREGRVNAAVDAGDFVRARRITNGGRIGLEDVAARREGLLAVLADNEDTSPRTRPKSLLPPSRERVG